jgi:SAM-dependent methyltransferase
MPSISFDPAADRYDASRGYPPETAQAIAAAIFRAAGARPRSHFLEIGVGTGRIAIPLLEQGADVTGVDISPRMVDRLRANLAARQSERPDLPWGVLHVRLADMTALPFDPGTFDAVVAVHVLHLVSEWRRALDEVLRVLRPGGALLIGQDQWPENAAGELQSRWTAIVRQLGSDVGYIGAGYSTVLDELRARGLTAEETRPVGWTVRRTPREDLNYIVQRVWSRTWQAPPDVFAESAQLLEAWAEQHFGPTLDVPQDRRAEFLLARIVTPA